MNIFRTVLFFNDGVESRSQLRYKTLAAAKRAAKRDVAFFNRYRMQVYKFAVESD